MVGVEVGGCEQPRGSEKMWELRVGSLDSELETRTAQGKGGGLGCRKQPPTLVRG